MSKINKVMTKLNPKIGKLSPRIASINSRNYYFVCVVACFHTNKVWLHKMMGRKLYIGGFKPSFIRIKQSLYIARAHTEPELID